jgi:hypothetical protein
MLPSFYKYQQQGDKMNWRDFFETGAYINFFGAAACGALLIAFGQALEDAPVREGTQNSESCPPQPEMNPVP